MPELKKWNYVKSEIQPNPKLCKFFDGHNCLDYSNNLKRPNANFIRIQLSLPEPTNQIKRHHFSFYGIISQELYLCTVFILSIYSILLSNIISLTDHWTHQQCFS